MTHEANQFQDFESYNVNNGKFLTPFQRKVLLKALQTHLQPEYRRRIEVMLLADRGKSQTQICEILGCSYHMARYWIGAAKAGLAHKWQDQPIGRPKSVNEQYLDRLKELVSHSPREYGYPFQCWTAQWLSKHLASEFGIEITERHINRLLKQMGLSTKQRHDRSKQETDDTKDSGITIGDLQLLPGESSLQWSLNFMKTDR
ncbi:MULTISPECIES: helix-turn-helix domain-containing protein [Nostocales]|uniref:Transposase n=2 Tax=Nostocales TaxID=1161 RepID=A0A0C1R487_9CYAN|nr:helix-turn-helix domain-containing protein [Tolypothrix bouteillei]KAF3886539.1 transposase [Tolypothrix bouteillei VB521301]